MAKNDISTDLIGKLVMVNPELTTDPADMRGEIGKIVKVLSSGEVRVEFNGDIKANYDTNALVTLLPKAAILNQLLDGAENLDRFEQKRILEVLAHALNKKPKVALKLAMESDATASYCTIVLYAWADRIGFVNTLKRLRANKSKW